MSGNEANEKIVANFDVIVIGCGLSGLTAAYEIFKSDSSIRLGLIEAKGRVGGRTLTENVNIGSNMQEKFDLGGQWVASSQPDILEILKELNIETYPQFITGTKVMQVGPGNVIRTYKSDIPSLGSYFGVIDLQLFIWKVESLAKQIPIEDPYSWNLAKEYDSITMETFVQKNSYTQAVRDTVLAACRSVMGCDLNRVSTLFFLAYANSAGGVMRLLMATENGAQELRVKGGTQQISELLADRIGRDKIYLKEAVELITQDEDSFINILTSTGKQFRAKYVISSLPPNCVRSIKFVPPLTEDRRLLMENMPVGHLTKFVVTYDKPYWREENFSGEIVSNGGDPLLGCSSGPLNVVYDATTHNNVPALVGFIAGSQGTEWNHKTREERRFSVLSALKQCFGDWALTPTSYTEKIWADEEYNGGCPVSFGVPGVMFTFKSLRRPHGRVHWCGTETSTHWAGYLNGAVQSGRRAALEILQLYGKDVDHLKKLVSRKPYEKDPPYYLPIMFSPLVLAVGLLVACIAVYYL